MVPDPDRDGLTVEQLRARVAQLQEALDSRVVIEQAKGILAERHSVTMTAAYHLLRGRSGRRRLPARSAVVEVTAGRLDLAPAHERARQPTGTP